MRRLLCKLEEDFYITNEKFYLDYDELKKFTKLCRSLDIPCGFALGPISNLKALTGGGLKPDFIKTLSISTENIDFMKSLYAAYDCPKYISVGLSGISYIKEEIIPLMSGCDMLSHTCLTHDSSDQNLLDIRALKEFGVPVCFGLHASDVEIAYAAVGAGAEKIFFYIGDKSSELPDFEHAVDLAHVNATVVKLNDCFSAMKSSTGIKKTHINFIK